MSAQALFHPLLRVQRRWERKKKTEEKKVGMKKERRGRLKKWRRKEGEKVRLRVGRKDRRKSKEVGSKERGDKGNEGARNGNKERRT